VEDLTEKEQLEALRTWWSENGSFVVGGIIVGVLIIFGWNRWQAGIAETEISASRLFEDVMEAAGRGNLDAASEAADGLFSEYDDTAYAGQARLAMARMYMDNARDQDAADVLRPLADMSSDDQLALVGRLRLAKILLYQNKAEEVVELVKDQPESAFSARFSEVLGDAYVALESYAEAEAAYIAALDDNPSVRTVDAALIQLKINDLPLVDELAAEASEAEADAATSAEPAAEETAAEESPAETVDDSAEDGEPEAE